MDFACTTDSGREFKGSFSLGKHFYYINFIFDLWVKYVSI